MTHTPNENTPPSEWPDVFQLTEQRDDLLAALEAATKLLLRLRDRELVADAPEIRQACAAIARAKGG